LPIADFRLKTFHHKGHEGSQGFLGDWPHARKNEPLSSFVSLVSFVVGLFNRQSAIGNEKAAEFSGGQN